MCATREKSEGRLLPHDGSILLIFFYTDVFPFIDEIGMELQMSNVITHQKLQLIEAVDHMLFIHQLYLSPHLSGRPAEHLCER